jgi:hypothetical protein
MQSYFLTMRLPDAQAFDAEYGIRYAQQRFGGLGVKIDKTFKFTPSVDPRPPSQGGGYVTYILHAQMTASAARAVAAQGISVERERSVFASDEG